MSNFAIIKGNAVINVIVADDAETAKIATDADEVIEINSNLNIGIGCIKENGKWINPTVTEEPVNDEG